MTFGLLDVLLPDKGPLVVPFKGDLGRGPKDHRSTRISHSGPKAQSKGDTKNDGW